ncbi:MAG: TIR domain-containing protein [Acidimicrobiales bacterium]
MSGVFISYRREDSSYIAGRLHDRLADALGAEHIFRDVDAMKPGADFTERIGEAVGSCEVLLAVIGQDWLSVRGPGGGRRIDEPRDWVRLEIAAALARDILVVPVLVENAQMPTEDELPEDLRALARRNAMDLTDRRWREDTENLLQVVREVMPDSELSPAAPAPPATAKPSPPRLRGRSGAAGGPEATPRPGALGAARRWWSGLSALGKVGVGLLAVVVLTVVGAIVDRLFGSEETTDSTATSALSYPQSMALDDAGNLLVADADSGTLMRVSLATGAVTEVEPTLSPELEAERVSQTPWAVAFAGGNLYVAGKEEGGIVRVDGNGVVTRVVARSAGSDLRGAMAIAVDSEGRPVVATDREVLRIGPDGSLATIAGGPTKGFGGDGVPATAAKLDTPSALAYGPDGSLYIADSGNRRIRRVGPDGTITAVAGTGSETPSGDGGPAVEAGLGAVTALAVDGDGNVYLAAEYQVRRIRPDGTINRIAGHPERESGLSGDGGPAVNAVFGNLTALAADDEGNLYIADESNDRIRRINAAGIIDTLAS